MYYERLRAATADDYRGFELHTGLDPAAAPAERETVA